MEPIFVGWLSLLPPLLAISLALITKEVMSSLLIGILSGSLIYACASGLNPFMGTLTTTFDLMASRVDMKILIFLGLLGALVVVVTLSLIHIFQKEIWEAISVTNTSAIYVNNSRFRIAPAFSFLLTSP